MQIPDSPPVLPVPAAILVPQRPPMLLVDSLLKRQREDNYSLIGAEAPREGIFVDLFGRVVPEYHIELLAQAMAAVNGYDALFDGVAARPGLLVGVEEFSWRLASAPGDHLTVELSKTFEFGPVSSMKGVIKRQDGLLLAQGEVRVWEEKL